MKEPKKRRFKVYVDCGHAGSTPHEQIIEFDAGTSSEEIDATCEEVLNTLIGNYLYTGWDEI